MSKMRAADYIAEYLLHEKVPYAFGLCGHGIIGFMDALYDRQDRIRVVGVHHEQVAGFMADAYFRVARRPVVTFTSCGPGSTNLVIALAAAMMDGSAFLAITGNVPTNQFNRGPFQETHRYYQADFPSVIRPYVKRSYQVTRTDMLPVALRQAFKTMMVGRPGPVNLDIPLNVFIEEVGDEVPNPEQWWWGIDRRPAAGEQAVERAVRLLQQAQRPVILVGGAAALSDCQAELVRLAERLVVPVAQTPSGAGAMPADHPLWLGSIGRNGTFPANQATRSADVLLALGVRFDDRESSAWIPGYTFQIPPTRLIQVDADEQELARNYPVHLGVQADPKVFLQQLLAWLDRDGGPGGQANGQTPVAATPGRSGWLGQVAAWKQEWRTYMDQRYRPEAKPISAQHLLRTLRRVLPRDGILAVDVGVHHNWVVQQWESYSPQTILQSWGFAAMGFGAAGVLGAKLAAPERPAVALCGDGGFLMVSHAVATAVEYGIPVTWVVWNNFGYVSIRDLQRGAFGPRELATMFARQESGELFSPDFALLARAYGAQGVRVESPGDLGDALEAALRSGRPTVVDVVMDREDAPVAVGTWQLPPLPHPEPNYPGLRRT